MEQEQEKQQKPPKKQLKTKTQNKVFARKNVFNRFKDYEINFEAISESFLIEDSDYTIDVENENELDT
jgi:hypothetical protein